MKPATTAFSYWPAPVPNLSRWTIAMVRRVLYEHENGDFRNAAMLATALDRNPRIFAALDTRIDSVLALPFKVEASRFDAQRASVDARKLEERWFEIMPESLLKRVLRWELTLGFCLCEQVYDTRSGGEWWPTRLTVVHPSCIRWEQWAGQWIVTTRDGDVPVETGDPRWVLFQRTDSQPWMQGVLRCLANENVLRDASLRDLARRSEKHGLPMLKAMVPAAADKEEKDEFFDQVSALGNESTLLLPQSETPGKSWDAELLDVKESTGGIFQTMLSIVDTDVSIALLGQNLTTEVKGGSFAAAQAHASVALIRTRSDVEMLATVSYEQVSKPWTLFNRGNNALAPWPTYDATPPEDKQALATTANLAGEAASKWDAALASRGLEVDLEAFALKVGVPTRKRTAPLPTPAPTAAPVAQEKQP